MRYNLLVVHGGKMAHADELLVIATAAALGWVTRVVRRNPTEEELNSPLVMVADVGKRHEPHLGNWDHHQRGVKEEAECAFSLLAKDITLPKGANLDEMLRLESSYAALKEIDVRGPFAYAKQCGIDSEVVSALHGFVATGLTQLLGEVESLEEGDPLFETLRLIGRNLLNDMDRLSIRLDELDNTVRIVEVEGVPGLVHESEDLFGMGKWRKKRAPGTAFSVSFDSWEPKGWALFRYDDDERVNFSRLNGREEIIHTAPNGFIAKTSSRLPLETVLGLVRDSIVTP
jgi:hypothetical protein